MNSQVHHTRYNKIAQAELNQKISILSDCLFSNGSSLVTSKYSLRYYVTFKVRKSESYYKINTFLQKSTTCIRLQAGQIFFVNI